MILQGLRCCVCNGEDLLAVHPGRAAVIEAGIITARGQPARAWCEACWPWTAPATPPVSQVQGQAP